MNKTFKVGDRVCKIGGFGINGDCPVGTLGTVKKVYYEDEYAEVTWDNGSQFWRGPSFKDIELVVTPESTEESHTNTESYFVPELKLYIHNGKAYQAFKVDLTVEISNV